MDKKTLVQRNAEEVLGEDQLRGILKKKKPIVYCGYETSGEIHLGHLLTITKLLDCMKAGFHVKVLFADWHTWLNRKGDWDFIHDQVKSWEKGFKASGLEKAEFVLGSSYQRSMEYIDDVLLMSLDTTLNRGIRSMQQVARDVDHAKISQVIYPLMQIEDIKCLKVDAVVSGIDQRKIHMLGTELFPLIKYHSPTFIHMPIIPSLQGPGKMSSSDKSSFISIRDSDKDILQKVKNAFCPLETRDNSVLSVAKLIVFPRFEKLTLQRDAKYGGNIELSSYEELEKLYLSGKIHPADLKQLVGQYLVQIIQPIRKAF